MTYHCIVMTSATGQPAGFTRINITALGAVTPGTPINLPPGEEGIENNLAAVYIGGKEERVSGTLKECSNGDTIQLPALNIAVVPDAPTNLTPGTFSSAQINFSWTDNSLVATQDNIYESTDDGVSFYPIDQVASAGAGATNSYAATGLSSATEYQFYITSASDYAESSPSNLIVSTTTGIAGPADLTATAASPTEVDLAWDDPAGQATSFIVQRSDDGGNTWNPISSDVPAVIGGTTTYVDSPVADGADFMYQIVGQNAAYIQSTPSVSAEAVTDVATPTDFTATSAADGSSVTLNWNLNSADTSGDMQFEIDRSQDGGATWDTVTVTNPGDPNSYVDSDVLGQTTYLYRIQAMNSVSESVYATYTVTTNLAVPASPANLATGAVTSTSVALTWSAGTDPGGAATGYTVSVSGDEGQTYTQFGDTLASTATGVTVAGLNPSTTYLFQVTADNTAGSSDPAGPVGAQTPAVADSAGDVTSLAASDGPPPWNSATLTWTGDTASGSDMEFEEKDVSTGESYHALVDTLENTDTAYTVYATNLTLGDQYLFRARTDRADGTVSTWQTTAPYTPYTLLSTPSVNVTPYTDSSGTQHLLVGWSGVPSDGFVQIEFQSDAYPDADPAGGWTMYNVDQSIDTHYAANTLQGAPYLPSGDQGCIEDPGVRYGSGIFYNYRVQAFTNVNGTWGTPSNWSIAQPGSLPEGTKTPVTPSAITTSSFTLNWTGYAAAGTSTSYDLFVVASQPYQPQTPPSYDGSVGIGSISATSDSSNTESMSYTYSACLPGMTYHCIVVTSATGQPAGFTRINVTALGAVTPSTPINLPPEEEGIENNLAAVYIGGSGPGNIGGSVQLHWYDSANNEGGFQIQRSDYPNFPSNDLTLKTFTTGTDVDEYTDGTVGPDSVYFYRVCATGDDSGNYNSIPTIVKQVNTPGVSIDITASTDPIGDPIIPFDGAVPVTATVPLGADPNGTATLSWNSAIEIFADSQLTTQLGITSNSFTWDISTGTSKKFYAEGLSGSVTYGDQSFHLSATLCLLSATTIQDDPDADYATTSPETTEPVSDIGIEIDYNGQPVNNNVPPNILVGSKITLTAKPVGPAANAKAVSYSWTVDATAESNYQANSASASNTALSSADLKKSTITFLWADATAAGTNKTAKCLLVANGVQYSRTADFKVFAPTITITATEDIVHSQKDTLNNNDPRIELGCGPGAPKNATDGMVIDATVSLPAGFASVGARWVFVQKVRVRRSYVDQNNVTMVATPTNDPETLDTSFPYPLVYAPGNRQDTLQQPLQMGVTADLRDDPGQTFSKTDKSFDIDDQFQSYVLFIPSQSNACYVQIANVYWNFGTKGTILNGLIDPNTTTSTLMDPAISKTVAEGPTWNKKIPPVTYVAKTGN